MILKKFIAQGNVLDLAVGVIIGFFNHRICAVSGGQTGGQTEAA